LRFVCLSSSRTPPQELCDVDIKEEENNETFNETFNTHHLNQSDIHGGGERLSVSPNHSISRNGIHEAESPATLSAAGALDASGAFLPGGADMSGFQANFNMNNISATLEALNALRSGQFPSAAAAAAAAIQQHQAQAQVAMHHQHNNNNNNNEDDEDGMKPLAKRQRTSSGSVLGSEDQPANLTASVPASAECQALERSGSSSNGVAIAGTAASSSVNGSSQSNFELRMFMDMQNKEHMMRMKILEVQLQAAKHSRDLVEINKTLALQKLQELASKRLPS